MSQALQFALQVLTMLPQLIDAGVQVKGLIQSTNTMLSKMVSENRDPTQEEWDQIDKVIEELRKQLHGGVLPANPE